MRSRPLFASLASLAVCGGLITAAVPATNAAPTAASSEAAAIRVSSSGGLRAVVQSAPGGEWTVRFTDRTGTVLSTVGHDAITLKTAGGALPADKVLSVHGASVEVGTANPAITATVRVTPAGEGVFAVSVVGHGPGISAVSLDLRARKDERYLGLGERSNAVDQRGRNVLNRVLDGPYTPGQGLILDGTIPDPGFRNRSDATYFPIPWVLSTAGYGVLVDNDEDSVFELATKAHRNVNRLTALATRLDLRVFHGPTPARALERMTRAIGRQPAPSTPALYGSWFQPNGADLLDQMKDQRKRDVAVSVAQTYVHYLPCGVQDTPRERERTRDFHAQGVAITTYFNPMVCTNYEPVYSAGVAAGAFTRNPDLSPLVYPYSTASDFEVAQIDFSGDAGRDLFHELLDESVDDGYDGWMEDFGEYTTADAVSADGTPGTAMHNRYVEQYHATARSFEEQAPRPLLRFQRSGWTDAVKESSIVWGGDPTTTWDFDGLTSSVRQGLTMGTSGVSIWGPDIGGFFTLPTDPRPTPELLTRWIEYGAFTGVMRLQSGGIHRGTDNYKPVLVTDPKVAPTWKRYSRLRTMLYPYTAGSHDAYKRHGLPLMRHLALTNPGDATAVGTDDEYLFGKDLLVAPVTKPGARSRKVYLPAGQWVELSQAWRLGTDGTIDLRRAEVLDGRQTVTARAPLGTIPLFVRVGAVVPMLPRSVDTLSDYGDGVVHLDDRADRRTLLAAPRYGQWRGPLGPGETITSSATGSTWTLRLSAERTRTYDVQATLTDLDWKPCRVTAGGQTVQFRYDAKRQVLRFTAKAGARGTVRVTACR